MDSSSTQKELLTCIPEIFFCGLTGVIMEDPVSDSDGHNYERAAITKYIQENGNAPTGKTMGIDELHSNSELQKKIKAWYNNPFLYIKKAIKESIHDNPESETVNLKMYGNIKFSEDDHRDNYQGEIQVQIQFR